MKHAFRAGLNCVLATCFAVVLAGLAIAEEQQENTPPEKPKKMAETETVVFVTDLHCKTCAKKIARKLYALKGVVKVRTNVEHNYAIVTPEKNKDVDPQHIWKAALAAKFKPTWLIGPSGSYEPDSDGETAKKVSESQAQVSNR